MATVANRQVANSAWLAELSKIAANSVMTYNSTSTTIPVDREDLFGSHFCFLVFCIFIL